MKPVSHLVAALVVACLPGAPADATELTRYSHESAARACAPAMPAYADATRTRPLGLANEGVGQVFVSCGFRGTYNGGNEKLEEASVFVGNEGAAPITVQCTLVHGRGEVFGNTLYLPAEIEVAPGTSRTFIWHRVLLPGQVMLQPNVSCKLPSGGVVYTLSMHYRENIGN